MYIYQLLSPRKYFYTNFNCQLFVQGDVSVCNITLILSVVTTYPLFYILYQFVN